MYNGGIVGYAGPDGSEVSSLNAYLKRLGIDPSRVKDATDAELANIKAAVEREMQKDRDKGAGLLRESLQGLSVRSEAKRLDDDERAAAEGKTLQGEAAINPPADDRNVREAERLRGLKSFEDTDYVNEGYYNINDQGSLDSYLATMEDPKFGAKGKDQFARGAPNIAEGLNDFAKYPKFNKKPEPVTPPLSEEDKRLNAASEALNPVGKKVEPKIGITSVLPEGNGMSPVMTRKERGEKELQDLGLDKKQDISALEPFMRKPEVNPNQSPIMTPKQQAEANKPLSGSAAIQKKLDDMGRKKGIAGLIQLAANTNFQPSYGGTGATLASAGRNIAETGQRETARERKFLEDQLGVQQAIEAAQVKEAGEESRFARNLGEVARQANQTNQRLEAKDYNINQNQIAQLAATNAKNFFDSKATLEELGLKEQQITQLGEHQRATAELQKAANQYKQDGVKASLHRVVQGYIESSNRLYDGLLNNANQEDIPIIMQQQQAEQARLARMIGTDGTSIDLSSIQNPPAGATAPDSGFSGFEKEE
tara:strand:- start:1989 stop:3602 length:1614 start_codon:yes stop_codon:yes gene_type:complete